jgi:hypothetical protein
VGKYNLAPWQSGHAEVCNTLYSGSIPLGASKEKEKLPQFLREFFVILIVGLFR